MRMRIEYEDEEERMDKIIDLEGNGGPGQSKSGFWPKKIPWEFPLPR